MSSSYSHVYLRELRKLIDKHFDLEEMRTLCFDLGLRYDSLRGEDKPSKVRELVDLMERRGRLDELVAMCREERPLVAWGEKKVQHGGTEDTEGEKRKERGTQGNSAELGGTQKGGIKRGENFEETGEPEWVEIPAGEFWMGIEGDEERPLHRLYLDIFWIAKTPVTNAQYRLFVQATGQRPPVHWQDGAIPVGLEQHPVVYVNWDDAIAYCRWLAQVTSKQITLPSEAEWEKAARGDKDTRKYPWGDSFDPQRANTKEAGIGATSPVDSFPSGASPYGVLDVSGNVWEWTRTIWGSSWGKPKFGFPYVVGDGREDLSSREMRVLRGGSFYHDKTLATCWSGNWAHGDGNLRDSYGVRLVVSPFHR